jgi:hypothetical protein
MSLMFVALIAWLGLMPLGFATAVVLLPPRLHRRATAATSAGVADVVDLDVARRRRTGVLPTGRSRAL